MYPISGDLRIQPKYAMHDDLILHEYAHWLQHDIGSLAWIGSDHNGCTITNIAVLSGGGLPPNHPDRIAQVAWMEGFADWFSAHVMREARPTGPPLYASRAMPDLRAADNLSMCSDIPDGFGEYVEFRIAASLWDLDDRNNEPGDAASGFARDILQIMDDDLGGRDWPTLRQFAKVMAHRLPEAELYRVLFHNKIDLVGLG
ncbi:hypothetical protein ACWCOV_38315 [Kribbella sp. NPDC002412]